MTTNKKGKKALNCVIECDLFERFESYCEDVGQTKTTALKRILSKFLDEHDQGKNSSVDKVGGN